MAGDRWKLVRRGKVLTAWRVGAVERGVVYFAELLTESDDKEFHVGGIESYGKRLAVIHKEMCWRPFWRTAILKHCQR